MGISCNSGKNHPKFIDLTGQVFGKLKILDYVQKQEKHGLVWKWKCLCECGEYTFTRTKDFTKEKPVQSCKKCSYKRMAQTNTLDNHQSLKNRVFRNYKRGAKNRNYNFELSKEEVFNLIFQNCHYCGQEPQELEGEKIYNNLDIPFKRNGIDRMNNDLGYTTQNTITCCQTCNKAKMEMNYQEFLDFINKVYQYINK